MKTIIKRTVALICAAIMAMVIPMDLPSVLADKGTDRTAPIVTKIEAETKEYEAGNTIEILFYAEDEDSGIAQEEPGEVTLTYDMKSQGSSGMSTHPAEYSFPIAKESEGVYRASIKVEDTWPSAEYHIASFVIRDEEGNECYSSENGEEYDYIFTITTSNKDNEIPQITNIERSKDVLRRGDVLEITVYANDNVALADDERNIITVGSSETNCYFDAPLSRIREGVYQATFTINDEWEIGEYFIWEVDMYDTSGNNTIVTAMIQEDTEHYNLLGLEVIDEPEESEEEIEEEDEAAPAISPSPSPTPTVSHSQSVTPVPETTEEPTPDEDAEDESETVEPIVFEDVVEDTWYAESVDYVVEKGYMEGTGNGQFSPNEKVTRGMIMQILYAQSGKPEVEITSSFSDLKEDKWYTDAVNWATENEIVSGYTDGTIKADNVITRQQMVAILYKYAQLKGYDTATNGSLSSYPDAGEVSGYAVDAMKWAVGHNLINGTTKGLDPKGTATRGQIAVILEAMDKNVKE